MSSPAEVWKFRPYPLLANPHLQTVMAVHWPRRTAPYAATRHIVTLDDGDQIVLHEDAPIGAVDETPSVLLVHGLTGSFESSYMSRMTEKLTAEGFRVFRVDMRGCGASEGLARRPAHCGLSSDVASAIHTIGELYCESPLSLVGYSLGGTLALNMLADAGELRIGNLEKTLAVCPPIDLLSCEKHFRTGFGKYYDRVFVKEIWHQIVRRWRIFPDIAPTSIPRRPPRLRDVDDMVIAPAGGFSSAEHYYRATQPGPKLTSIRQPVTIVFSKDDPVVPCGPLFDFPHSDSIETIVTTHGGHLGFLGMRGIDPDFHWLDWRIVEWLTQPHQPRNAQDFAEAANAKAP